MAELTYEKIANAIKATDYKYFGDYELSGKQRDAVETLVDAAVELMSFSGIESELRKMQRKVADMQSKIDSHNEVFKGIYSSCIGELTMGYKIDAASLGEYVYSVCDFNAEGKSK